MRRRGAACLLFAGLLVAAPGIGRAQQETPPPPPPDENTQLPLPEAVMDPSVPTAESNPDCVDDGEGGCLLEEEIVEQEIDTEAYSDFNQTMAPYGTWTDTTDYGQVWFPSTSVVGSDFMPYSTGGHWVMTEYGWTWVSDWDWGWAAFHYGRWLWLNNMWGWMPGRTWGPAWVNWRRAGGYVGWSPLPPRRCTTGVRPWRFTPQNHLGQPRMPFVNAGVVPGLLARSRGGNAWRATTSGTRYNAGLPTSMMGTHRVTPTSLAQYRPTTPSPMYRPTTPAPAYRPMAPSTGPRTWNSTPTYNPSPTYVRPMNPTPTYTNPAYTNPTYTRPSYTAPTYTRPSYTAPTYNAPTYRAPAPTYTAPTYRAPAPTYHSPAPTYRSPAPMYHPAPTYRAPAPSYSPSFRSSSPAPSFRSSAPAPSFRASSPAPSFRSSPGGSFRGGGRR
jgi:hypothetical protein